jgi:hypothetical protein
VFLTYALMAKNCPHKTAFVVSHRFWLVLFSFSFSYQKTFDFLSYFFYDPLILEQCVIHPPIIYIFYSAVFVVEFWF